MKAGARSRRGRDTFT